MDRFTVKLDGDDVIFTIKSLELWGCRAFITASSKIFSEDRLFVTSQGLNRLFMKTSNEDYKINYKFRPNLYKSVYNYNRSFITPDKDPDLDWGPADYSGSYMPIECLELLNCDPDYLTLYETMPFQPLDNKDIYKLQTNNEYKFDFIRNYKGTTPKNLLNKHPLLVDLTLDFVHRPKDPIQERLCIKNQSDLFDISSFDTPEEVKTRQKLENDLLFNKINVYHGVNIYSEEFWDYDSVLKSMTYKNSHHISSKNFVSEQSISRIIRKCAGDDSWNYSFSKNNPWKIFIPLEEFNLIKQDCGHSYIKKYNLFRIPQTRTYALRYLYELFRIIDHLTSKKQTLERVAPKINKYAYKYRPILISRWMDGYNFLLSIAIDSQKEDYKGKLCSIAQNGFGFESKIRPLTVECTYDFEKDDFMFGEFGNRSSFMKYIKNSLGTEIALTFSKALITYLKYKRSPGIIKKILIPMYPTGLARQSGLSIDSLTIYTFPIDPWTEQNNRICVDLYEFIALFCTKTSLIYNKINILTSLSMRHIKELGFDDIEVGRKSEALFANPLKEEIRFRSAEMQEEDIKITDTLINLSDAIHILYRIEKIGGYNQKWYDNANKLLMFAPDALSQINGEWPSDYYLHTTPLREYVTEIHSKEKELEFFNQSSNTKSRREVTI